MRNTTKTSGPESFGQYLRRIRESKGINLPTFAEYLGCSKSYVSDVERGQRNPFNGVKLKRISKYLELDLTDLTFRANQSLGKFILPATTEQANQLAGTLVSVWSKLTPDQLSLLEGSVKDMLR